MKISKIKVFPIVVLTLLFTAHCNAQEATFEETEVWLNENLANNFTLYKSNAKTFTYDYKSVIRDCKCTSTVFETLDNKQSNVYVTYDFNFKVLNYQVNKFYYDEKGYGRLTLFVLENKNLVNRKVVWTESKEVESQSVENEFEIYFQSDELATRSKKALEHYIKICKEKKEKF